MIRYGSKTTTAPRVVARVALAGLILVALALATAGCSSAATGPNMAAKPAMPAKATPATSKMSGMAKSTNATGMVCIECSGKGMPARVSGQPTVTNGVQIVTIALKDGQFTPNAFTVQAGMPVKVSFEGTATGCLGHPMFESLGKKADVTKSPASLDLGTLKPGAYKFSCAMGMNAGTITVQ